MGNGMSRKMYEYIAKYKHLIDIDLDNGIITTPKKTNGTICSNTGYLRVKIKGRLCQVHQIIAVCLYGEKCVGLQVNHIDSNRTNNSPENLELLTQEENIKEQLNRNKRESKGAFKKATKVIATNIKTGEKVYFDSVSEAEKKLKANVSHVRRGTQKTGKGYTFEFIEP